MNEIMINTRTRTYDLMVGLIERGNYEYEDMLMKADVFLMANRITSAEYNNLIKMLNNRLPKDEVEDIPIEETE